MTTFSYRILNSNNRSLATLFGCIFGFIFSIVLILNDTAYFPLLGKMSQLTIFNKIIGILLATGTCGNLSSYIGGSIDIVTGDVTIFSFCRKQNQVVDNPV